VTLIGDPNADVGNLEPDKALFNWVVRGDFSAICPEIEVVQVLAGGLVVGEGDLVAVDVNAPSVIESELINPMMSHGR